MTARSRVIAMRRTITSVMLARAVAVGGAIIAFSIATSRTFALPVAALVALVAAGVGIALAMAARARPAKSLEQVALWIEERHPSLQYALVTAAALGMDNPDLEVQALSNPWWDQERQYLLRRLLVPFVALAAAIGLLAWNPAFVTRMSADNARGPRTLGAETRPGMDPLARVRLRIEPPAYAGRRITEIDDPSGADALVGSTIIVTGEGPGRMVRMSVDSTDMPVVSRGDRWSARVAMPSRAALIRLRAPSSRERLIVLAPLTDAAPVVTLILPAQDTVVRAAVGTMTLRAAVRDDIGLRDATFEIIVSSGQEENFTFRTMTLARTQLAGAAEHTLDLRLSLDSLALKPGDVLQMRAVARDRNTVTGPGVGSSETRALRVSRASEYDSVAVDAAPPGEPDAQVLSQRMLIMLTEALDTRRPRLARPTLIAEAQRIAADQARLRKRVGDIVFQRVGGEPLSEESSIQAPIGKVTPEELLARAQEATKGTAGEVMDIEGDETPILSVSKPLLEAFNAMWDAGRALEQGDTRQAIPPMRRALAAIERARQAERIYLRGRPSAVVVDVARARLAGKDKGTSSLREARAIVDPVERRRAERFARATLLLAHDPAAAADTLLVMRVAALGEAPALAAVLDDAVRSLRSGEPRAILSAWARVRRALDGAPVTRSSIPAWSGAP
ncbi:MAG: hypothetical protein ABIV10_14655 [Gemmatimonadaceae bacterium]